MRRIRNILIFFLLLALLQNCFFNRFIYTDKELKEHYENKTLSPTYRTQTFLNRNVHYAVISKSDTLPLLVFVHGAPGAWYGYLNLMDDSLLQSHFKLISVDRLGYGKSGYGKAELSTQIQALAIKKIIDIENTQHKKVTILGRSYGAPIAGYLAINYPALVNKLVMVSPVIDPEKEKFFWFSNLGKWDVVRFCLPKMMNVATDEKFSHQREMQTMLPKWKNLYVNTTVIMGEMDWVADTSNLTFAKKHIINCKASFIKLKNTGHLVTGQQPEVIKQILINNN